MPQSSRSMSLFPSLHLNQRDIMNYPRIRLTKFASPCTECTIFKQGPSTLQTSSPSISCSERFRVK
ncbi:hypothetical protein PIB30_017341 [Stylosanthes scabra]|uniref:Uncharacterized protein n=1 Tax=Stylosanthes scabra TaxID=79078 RepID=A0ABU6T7B3_9FABA|nr:hypothetical protein [Stylosanthes scabra]